MIKVTTEDRNLPEFDTFIDECIVALFPDGVNYDINIRYAKFIEDTGLYGGLCTGDQDSSTIDIATHWKYEDGEIIKYEPHEMAGTLAHELTHAKQFCKSQINMVDHVWKHNGVHTDCADLEYMDHPWEVEAYEYEKILVDLLWENV